MTDELRLNRLDVNAHDDEWGALAAEAGNIFGTPEWISTWWRHYGGDRRMLATACRREDGGLVAVLPLYLRMRRPIRVVRFVGHGPGDALGPICRRCDRPAVASALLSSLEDGGAALLVGERLPREEGWSVLLGARVVKREESPVIALDGVTWESFLASRGGRLGHRIRSKERKLAAQHRVRYRLAADPARFERDLDLLFELHRARWPKGSSFNEAEAFHREFATLALARGWCRLWLLELDGEARAAWYGFRFANAEFYYQAGRDPRWDRYSLGLLMLVHSIREAMSDGLREYRLLRGGEGFKYRFASSDPGLETIALAGSPAGEAALQAAVRIPRPLLRVFARPWIGLTLYASVVSTALPAVV
jgi:CelD/BcsL family acetyltransferase involved in cellulose biosynthesis